MEKRYVKLVKRDAEADATIRKMGRITTAWNWGACKSWFPLGSLGALLEWVSMRMRGTGRAKALQGGTLEVCREAEQEITTFSCESACLHVWTIVARAFYISFVCVEYLYNARQQMTLLIKLNCL